MALTSVIASLFSDQATYTNASPGSLVTVNAGTITRTPVGARVSGNGFAGAFPLLAAAVAHLALSCGGATGFALWISFYMTDLNADGGGGTLGKTFINLGGSAYNTNCINDGGDPGISIGPTGLVKYNNTSNLFAIGTVRAKKEYKMLITGSPRDFQSFQTDIFFAADDGSAFGAAAFSSFTLFNTRANTVGWVGAFTQSTTAVISGYYLKTGSTSEIAAIAAAPNTLPVANLLGSPTIAQLPLYVRSDATGGNDGSANDAAHALTNDEASGLIVAFPDVPWAAADNTTWDHTSTAFVSFGKYRYGTTADPLNHPVVLSSPGLKWNGARLLLGTNIVLNSPLAGDYSIESADGTEKAISGEYAIAPSFTQPNAGSFPKVWSFTLSGIEDGALYEDGKVMHLVVPDGVSATASSSGTTVTATTSVFTAGQVNGVITQSAAHTVSFTIASRTSGTVVTVDRVIDGGMGPWSGTSVKIFAQDPTLSCTESGNAYASINAALTAIPGAFCIIGNKCYFSTFDGAAASGHNYTVARAMGRSQNKGSLPMVSVPYIRNIHITGGMTVPVGSSSPIGSSFEYRDSGTLAISDCLRVTRGGYYAAEWSPASTASRLIMVNTNLGKQATIIGSGGTSYWVTTSGTGATFIARSSYSGSNTPQDNQILIINDNPQYPGVVTASDAVVGSLNAGVNNGARDFIIRTTDDGTDRNFQFSILNIYFSAFCAKQIDRAAVVTQYDYQLGTSGVVSGGSGRSLFVVGSN